VDTFTAERGSPHQVTQHDSKLQAVMGCGSVKWKARFGQAFFVALHGVRASSAWSA
jgi:hypothetical protein